MTEADPTVSGVIDDCFGQADAAIGRMPRRIATKNVEAHRTREIRSSSTVGKSTEHGPFVRRGSVLRQRVQPRADVRRLRRPCDCSPKSQDL